MSALALLLVVLATYWLDTATPPASTPPPTPVVSAADGSVPLRLIAFNDFHGNLRSPGKLPRPGTGALTTVGGVDALAGYVAGLRREVPNSVVVAGGDLVGASPLVSALFHDEPAVETLNRLGLDLSSVGNHEFDAGRDELMRKQRGGCHADRPHSCQGDRAGTPVPFEGARYQWLAANVIDQDSSEPLLPATAIRRFDGIPVGFVGLTLAGTSRIVSPRGITGLSFRDEAETVNAAVDALARQGVRSVVVLIHQGGEQGAGSAPPQDSYNSCADALQSDQISPIRALVRQFDDRVDLVVSGHSHTVYNCRLPNRAGRPIAVTQALSFGRMLSRIDAVLDRGTGRLQVKEVQNLLIDREQPAYPPDPAIAGIVAAYETLAAPLARQPIGQLSAPVSNDADASGERPAGDLVADAQLAAARAQAAADFAVINPGGVRGGGFVGDARPLEISFGDAFTLQPFGNSLEVLELSATQLKEALEQQFPGCAGQTIQKILQWSAGVQVRWSASAQPCAHVLDLTFDHDGQQEVLVEHGQVHLPERSYRVVMNGFLAGGGDGFTAFTRGRAVGGAGQDVDALASYLRNFAAPAPPYDPAASSLQRPRLVKVP